MQYWPIAVFFIGILSFFLFFIDVLLPFMIGMIFAYMFNPLVSKIHTTMKISRSISAATLVLGLFSGIVLFLIVLVPYVQTYLIYLAHHMPDYIKVIEHQVTKIALQFSDFLSEKDIAYIQEGVSNSIHGVIDWCVNFASGLLSKGFVVANILSLIIITPIVAIFFLKDWPRFVEELDLLMPKRYRSIIRQLCTEMNQKLSFFVRGQAVIAFILMMYYTVSLSILKLEGALLIGIVAGLFSFIPYFAVSFGFIMSLFSGFLGNFEFMGYMGILGVFIIGSMLEGAILSPLLIGNSVGLHPLWIVFSVMSGAKIVGFMGVIIAVPTAAIVGVLIRFGIRKYLESSYYRK